jgi:hypothetical protein
MINLISYQLQKTILFFSLLMSFVVLQGCGSERDTPFIDPRSASASSGGSGPAVAIRLVKDGDKPKMGFTEGKTIQFLREESEFVKVWDMYFEGDYPKDQINFATGQVVFHDAGKRDKCETEKDLVKVTAYDSARGVDVVFEYSGATNSSTSAASGSSVKSSATASSSASSQCSTLDTVQKFKVFFLSSRENAYARE